MKIGLLASLVLHVAGLAVVPGQDPSPLSTEESVAAACRCDYEVTITDGRPPRALTLGVVPLDRLK